LRSFVFVLIAALALTMPAAPFAMGSGSQAVLDLSATVPAGEYRVHRVLLREAAQVEFGGTYQGVQTVQPVLPILAAVERLDAGCARGCSGAIFAYDWGMWNKPLALYADVRNDLVDQGHGTYNIGGGGWFTTATLDPGEYLLLAASAPAETGQATLRLRVLGAADVLASQAGESFWARGYDLSDSAYDVHAASRAGVYARAWGYSGAEASLDVQGRMFGYLGYHQQGGARWEGPSPAQWGFIQDGEPGAYEAIFPAEEWMGPICDPVLGCDPAFGDTREDPTFALAVDVRIA
jgi:hypothetical protein